MNDVNDITDYVILSCNEAGESLTLLKLQKLIYYVQAWHLAFFRKRLFDEHFQAWVHGPVSRKIYDRFADQKTLYSFVGKTDIRDGFDPDTNLSPEARLHVNTVLEAYAGYSGSQLEAMTHSERPWQEAREGIDPAARCENLIDEELMASFYSSRL